MQKLLLTIISSLVVLCAFADDRTPVRGEYWFDDQQNSRVSVSITADGRMDFAADASALPEGLHRLNYRAVDSEGDWSALHTWLFFRYVPETIGNTTLEYWIDENRHQTLPITESVTDFQVDASACTEGLHRLNYRLKSDANDNGAINTWLFYRYVPEQALTPPVLHYWIDGGQRHTRVIDGDEVSFLADASLLAEGLHTISYRVVCSNDKGSATQSWTFYKVSTAPKATSLKWYRVWWNNHEGKAIEVQLPNGTAEYLYEETLAVPEYARNDDWSRNSTATFHVVFCDDLGQLSPVQSAEVPYPDVYPPRTKLTATLRADSVSLSWTANKDNVRDYNVYYSENNQPYVLWLPNTTRTDAVFRGQRGTTYRFLVTARDDKGNFEAMEESRAVRVEFK